VTGTIRGGDGIRDEELCDALIAGSSRQTDRMDDRKDCPFCAICDGDASADIVMADEIAVAFLDRSPLFPGHVLVVPRQHVVTLPDLPTDAVGPFFQRVQRFAAVMPQALDAHGTFVANNNIVSQSVAHLHVHVVPRRRRDGLRGFFWPRQRYAEGEAAAIADVLRAAIAGSA
jgi:histidine triad (HIT) family protein